MTVCVAALASYTKESSALVCVADKLVSYGLSITGETDSSKIVELNPSGMLCMISGNEEGISYYLSSLLATESFGSTARDVCGSCEAQYKTCLEELIDRKFLSPRLLTRDGFIAGTSGSSINEYLKELAAKVSSYDMECDVLVCGYEEKHEMPFIFEVTHPGIATDLSRTGFHAIGAGWEHAIGKLISEGHERKDSLPHVMYDALDAKISAEIGPFVGADTDTVIITHTQGSIKRHTVPKEINELLDRVWMTVNRTPFQEAYDNPPPRNWRKKLNDYAESILRGSSVPVDKRKVTS